MSNSLVIINPTPDQLGGIDWWLFAATPAQQAQYPIAFHPTPEQIASLSSQRRPPQVPPVTDVLARMRVAPDNWARYFSGFASTDEWGALDALFGVPAVNVVKQWYGGGGGIYFPGTMLRNPDGTYTYTFTWPPRTAVQTDTGQVDAILAQISGQTPPSLPPF